MAILFADSFSGYRTADLPTRWKGGILGSPQIDNTVLPPGSQAGAQVLDCTASAAVTSDNYGAQSHFILGFRHYRLNNAGGLVCGLLHNTAPLFQSYSVVLQMTNSGTFICKDDLTVIGSGPIVPALEWHSFELDCQLGLSGTANVHLYMDGSPTPFISAVGVSTTFAVAEQFFLGRANSATAPSTSQDQAYNADFYALNGTGPVAMFNAPLAPQGFGGAKMAFAVANGPGIISNWTANGAATIWECIDQIPQDGDTTYASDATPGDQYQCTFNALPAMSSLLAVQLSTYARTDDAGPRAYQSGFWSSGTFGYSGVNQFLGGSYNYIEDEFMLNPVTGLAWTPGDLTGLQFGAKLTV